ncbi:MAG: tRNA (adenosine(37)-N6)-threonylcarbamoyltransferase complex transferase subunit TsaD [Candidatus Kaiserbacteria bacterium]|nr:tRNA (adenosine(37)-N6)-threonylcarbamoyltransferase complex transferase subunit TsaD [Candidatus Kaiserbacteria bacterium]
MRILSIETSCDETAVALLSFSDTGGSVACQVLGEKLYSQAEKHAAYGGVYPNLAKREHQHNLPHLTHDLLQELNLLSDDPSVLCTDEMASWCDRDQDLFNTAKELFEKKAVHGIDRIAVTRGPGLSPALWVGINAAKLYAALWNIPIIPINHMEGHIVAALLSRDKCLITPAYPLLALLVSGGHTQLVLSESANKYQILGGTVDDAAGEAFDKVARLLGLPYPGGPEIARLAKEARKRDLTSSVSLPRPMSKDETYNVSFAGLKTAVRTVAEKTAFSEDEKKALARELEDAVTETLLAKLQRAIEAYHPRSVVLSGGVAANEHVRTAVKTLVQSYPSVDYYQPTARQATDNAVMIGVAAYRRQNVTDNPANLTADPNLSLAT